MFVACGLWKRSQPIASENLLSGSHIMFMSRIQLPVVSMLTAQLLSAIVISFFVSSCAAPELGSTIDLGLESSKAAPKKTRSRAKDLKKKSEDVEKGQDGNTVISRETPGGAAALGKAQPMPPVVAVAEKPVTVLPDDPDVPTPVSDMPAPKPANSQGSVKTNQVSAVKSDHEQPEKEKSGFSFFKRSAKKEVSPGQNSKNQADATLANEDVADRGQPPDGDARDKKADAQKSDDTAESEKAADQSAKDGASNSPEIAPGHVLAVTVVVNGAKEVEELGKRVSSTGAITLPLVGLVKVAGMTAEELSRDLQEKYSVFMRNPTVDCGFMVDNSPGAISPWGYVTVLGAVMAPGRINIPPTQDLSLSMAIQLSGGYADSAKDTSIRVTRVMEDKNLKSWDVNLRSAASEGKTENDLMLKAGDVIFVPEKVF
jgi:polysaccharide export outer membrane protein